MHCITLQRPAAVPKQIPAGWLQASVEGNVLSFVDTQFSDERLAADIGSLLSGIRQVDVEPLPLRIIFTTLARERQQSGAQGALR